MGSGQSWNFALTGDWDDGRARCLSRMDQARGTAQRRAGAAASRSGARRELQAANPAPVLPPAGTRRAHGAGRCLHGGRSFREGAAPDRGAAWAGDLGAARGLCRRGMVSVAHRIRETQRQIHRGGGHRLWIARLAGRSGAICQRAQRENGALVFATHRGNGGTLALSRLGMRARSGRRCCRGQRPGALREPGVAAPTGAGGRGTGATGGTRSRLHGRESEGGGDEGPAVCAAARAFSAARPAAARHQLSPEVCGISGAAG